MSLSEDGRAERGIMYKIDDELKEFVESGVAVIVGVGDISGRPQMAYGWGPRVEADRSTLNVFLDTARTDVVLKKLHPNKLIAVTFADPVSYRSVQLKGMIRGSAAPDEADRAWVQRQREAFVAATSLVGDPPDTIRNMWLDDVTRVELSVEHAFDQTPGPNAGQPL